MTRPETPADPPPGAGRRNFLRGVIGAGAAAAVTGAGVTGYAARAAQAAPASTRPASTGPAGTPADPAATLPAVPFHGPNQAGILPDSQRQVLVCAFDVTASNRGELIGAMRALTDRARFLTAGGMPVPSGRSGPPSDSGVLGPDVVPDGLTVTVGLGASLFDGRYGLSSRKPANLTVMPPFPDDNLDPAQCNGDLSLVLAAGSRDTLLHALRDIARYTEGAMQVRWQIGGFSNPPRPSGTPRNLMGFKDGISNPDAAEAAEMNRFVWVPSGDPQEPAWTAGGSYQVIRLIRMYVEFWDRVSVTEQERMFGRRRDTGAPLDANGEFDTPDYAKDPSGAVIPLDAHMRLANPRTKQTDGSRILRRGYNYERGADRVGDQDMGLIFTCYQRNPKLQFEAVQNRLNGEPLTDYIGPFGGGYFFALPGVKDSSGYFGQTLLT
jgi:deferrochelatase/peroxidase EfeB